MNADYVKLQNQIAELQKQAEEILKEERKQAIADIKKKMQELHISPGDLGLRAQQESKHVPVKYRHPASGETWSGRGQLPRWMRDEISRGATKEQFLVTSA